MGLDAVNAFLGIADADAARARAGAVMAAVVAKGMSGRPKTVERAMETCLLLCELECAEVVVAALVDKGTKHKVPKCALASTEAAPDLVPRDRPLQRAALVLRRQSPHQNSARSGWPPARFAASGAAWR